MKLTRYSDYALRLMIHLTTHGDEMISIRQIAQAYGISHNHLMKIVQDLGHAGFVETLRGRKGGLRLARPPQEISIGALVRHTEGYCALVDCRDCLIAPSCRLPGIFAAAIDAFMQVLDRYTLADLVVRPDEMRALFDTAALPAGDQPRPRPA